MILKKLYEVREYTKKVARVGVGDVLIFFVGKWKVSCNITSLYRVQGTTALLNKFPWFSLIPSASCKMDCKKLYQGLGCTETKWLVVWGLEPFHMQVRGFSNSNHDTYTDVLKSKAKQLLATDYKYMSDTN